MSRIYWRKHVPMVVQTYFERRFNDPAHRLHFYSYKGREGRTYGCMVYRDEQLIHYATQETEQWFAEQYTQNMAVLA